MPCYLTVQDRDLGVLAANRKFRDDFGDHTGRKCFQIYKRRSEKCENCPVEQTYHDGQTHSSEEIVTTLDGREVSVLVQTTPLLDADGQVQAVMEMSTDITRMKRLERQLRVSRERYRLLFEEVPCFISIQDRDLNIIEANRLFRDNFGSHFGCKCYDAYKHRDEECLDCPVQRTFQDGEIHHSEEVVTSISGRQLNTLVYTAPIRNAAGEIQSVMEMGANITPIRELQSQLEATGLLISSISHGIKGLLTGLEGGFYLVNTGMEKEDPKRLHKGWEMVRRNVERIKGLVLNILYYAKERQPQLEVFDASKLVEDICRQMESRAGENQVSLSMDLDVDQPEIEADENALRAMLNNLLENALDACRVDKKKPQHQVWISYQSFPSHAEFRVRDNGIGMDRETREKVFSLFFSSKGTEGTGLGLFIANNIAKAHGGRIDVESELEQGTQFVVTLPKRDTRSTAVEEPPREKGID